MTFTHVFSEDFSIIEKKIASGENFCLSRYADGEYHVMNALGIKGIDGWVMSDQDKEIAKDLSEAFTHKEDNFFYGISCPCCDPPKYQWLREAVQQRWDRITFSNLFVNANFQKFVGMIQRLNRPTVVFANESAERDNYPFEVLDLVPVKSDVISWYKQDREAILKEAEALAEKHSDVLFLISAGPLSEILISKMFSKNNNNTYIDVGSSLDPWTHKKVTRSYQHPSEFSNRSCSFE